MNNNYNFMNDRVSSSPNLFNLKNGFLNGNMFRSLYQGYKNYQPMSLKVSSDQENKMLELLEVSFALHELNLYLDLHPEDESMFLLFQDYQRKEKILKEEYESIYGPMCIDSNMKNFSWIYNWPWEGNNV